MREVRLGNKSKGAVSSSFSLVKIASTSPPDICRSSSCTRALTIEIGKRFSNLLHPITCNFLNLENEFARSWSRHNALILSSPFIYKDSKPRSATYAIDDPFG